MITLTEKEIKQIQELAKTETHPLVKELEQNGSLEVGSEITKKFINLLAYKYALLCKKAGFTTSSEDFYGLLMATKVAGIVTVKIMPALSKYDKDIFSLLITSIEAEEDEGQIMLDMGVYTIGLALLMFEGIPKKELLEGKYKRVVADLSDDLQRMLAGAINDYSPAEDKFVWE